jgi:hypothetical protein
MTPKDDYRDGECPDCGTPIDEKAQFGDNCPNCEHVFNNTENENCLVGFRCPKCKSKGPFRLVATCWALVSDDGVEDTTEHEWGDDAACICAHCKHDAQVKDFANSTPDADEQAEKRHEADLAPLESGVGVDADLAKCERCGGTDRVALQPNPYDADIHGDYDVHWLCEPCCETLRDEI